jgi:site-specific DNA recombinase
LFEISVFREVLQLFAVADIPLGEAMQAVLNKIAVVASRCPGKRTTHAPGGKQRERPHYLKSTIFCGSCGSRLIVTKTKNRYGVIYPYFVCLGRHQKTAACTRKATLIPVVEGHYATVRLDSENREQIRQLILADVAADRTAADAEAKQVVVRRQRLINERAKLLQARYAGAVPLEQLKSEQDRIAAGLAQIDDRMSRAQASYDQIEANLTVALTLLDHPQQGYLQARPHVRRLLNQAFFVKLYLEDDGLRAELAEPFATLLGPDLRAALAREEASRARLGGIEAVRALPRIRCGNVKQRAGQGVQQAVE